MSRYHDLVDVHTGNADLIDSKVQRILAVLENGDLDTARTEVTRLHDPAAKMQMALEEMSLLVRVLMLEFQVGDDARRANGLSRPRTKASADTQRAVQLELLALLTEIKAKQQLGT